MPTKPVRLQPGDKIGIVSPASAPPDPTAIDRAAEAITRLGFLVQVGRHARERWGFLAGSDRDRADDLMGMFHDKSVRGIICMRGGYGTARLLPMLDYRVIRANPKVLIGYSDITSLHSALLIKADLVCFHGPMLNSDFIKPEMPEFTLRSFRRTVMEAQPVGSICEGYKKRTVAVLRPGVVSGPLVGGNLSLLCASMGTPWQPQFKKAILFFEDLDEVPYRFDRMLTQLLNAGVLQQVKGIAVGVNANCKDPKAKKSKEYRQTVEEVLSERLLPLDVPLVIGLPFGHVPWNATLPIGVQVTLDADVGDLRIDETAVR